MPIALPVIAADPIDTALAQLATTLAGELHTDLTTRRLYATDASEYEEFPRAVVTPKTDADIAALLAFANRQHLGLIPRAAGTSLAGQVVGNGVVLDLGRHMNAIISIDPQRRRAVVQPGVVRNELNLAAKPHGLHFGPETSTANRAMIGGMVGNNSCGSNSIVYGSTRDHLIAARGFWSDGTPATLGPLTSSEFAAKCDAADSIETRIYKHVRDLLSEPINRSLIRENFPKPTVTRRNTGYAIDALMDATVFDPASDRSFNLCKLIAGSEGTLFLGTEFELNLEPLPPAGALMCAHFDSIDAALRATIIAMRHRPFGCELIDRIILDCTKANLEQAKNRFFVQGDPAAVLVVELRNADREVVEATFRTLEAELRSAHLGYAFPTVWGDDVNRVWELRRAGQGLANNVPGVAKPREVVEDTAVAVDDLPAYIAEFDRLMRDKYGIASVYYAHAGAGELHTRPTFDLKTPAGLKMFRDIATDVAALVKKYRGSLSGEHGDGRLRGEFIESMVGPECFAMMRQLKVVFDPNNVLNPGKIIDTPPMDTHLRHDPAHTHAGPDTIFDFSADGGVLLAIERCTGVGECRKTERMGGTMCPSYMATRNERDTTRARANVLRQLLTDPGNAGSPWASDEIANVMDLCLSCKGCKSECPSNVDMARLKAEWQQHYHDAHGVPLRSRMMANIGPTMRVASLAPAIYNAITDTALFKRMAGIAPQRTLPRLAKTTLAAWHRRHANPRNRVYANGRVYLFCDEFTNYFDAHIGIAAVRLLNRLGYEVLIPQHVDSGRAQLSKGFVRAARSLAIRNVLLLRDVITEQTPLIGIEPSALLGFRDEYLDLMPIGLKSAARFLAANALLIDEFIAREATAGRIRSESFIDREQKILLHGHCHQKALSSVSHTAAMLRLPRNFTVEIIPSGCCGMAGSFGYEAEHFAVSQQIGELVLLPTLRAADSTDLIAAPGTSCRHQIKDGTGRSALHPVEILLHASV